MPLYELRCQGCGQLAERYAPISVGKGSTSCPSCQCVMRRVYTPPATPVPFQEHFNRSVGSFVRTEREFKEKLRQASDAMSERMGGMKVDYQPVPLAEAPHSEAGLDTMRKRRRDTGQDSSKRTIIT